MIQVREALKDVAIGGKSDLVEAPIELRAR